MGSACRYQVTTASFVPSQLHVLAREITALHSSADIAAGTAPCASLKRVLSGGEALTSTAAAEIQAALPRCQLWNTYGPTETTVGITCWLYDPTSAGSSNTIPIGRGIHNSRLYVLNSNMQPVAIGVPGQLFISGVCVSGGYLNRPDLNADVFVPNPFHHMEKPGSCTEVMYRTGRAVSCTECPFPSCSDEFSRCWIPNITHLPAEYTRHIITLHAGISQTLRLRTIQASNRCVVAAAAVIQVIWCGGCLVTQMESWSSLAG